MQPARRKYIFKYYLTAMTRSSTHKPIFIGARDFMHDFASVAGNAKRRVYVQAMTFEGDSAGEELIQLLSDSPAPDRKLCIDRYSTVVVNDTFVASPRWLRDASFREEIRRGKRLLKQAREQGIGIAFTNPVGPLLLRYPFRNHKKLVICDDTVYIGGINFSEHNFAWHDMMIRLDDPSLADILSNDVLSNYAGRKTCTHAVWSHGEVYMLNRTDEELWKKLLEHFREARKSITIVSPYVSWPLLEVLREVGQNGIDIRIISPAVNNKSLFRKNLMHECAKGYFKLHLYNGGMSHLKAALIDDTTLIAGSSNYDFASYFFEEEVMLTIHDPKIISAFHNRVVNPMLDNSSLVTSKHPEWGKYFSSARLLQLITESLKRIS
jgi:cardiolipin synthase